MLTYGDLCTGFGMATVGALACGLRPLWGIEYDPKIAAVANANLAGHVLVADILDVDPRLLPAVDVLHMSPPCVRASVANSSAEVNEDGLKESPLDIALAEKCMEFISVMHPRIVALENVWGYRKFQSWRGGKKTQGLERTLYENGYMLHIDHVNFANMGGITLCPLHDSRCIKQYAQRVAENYYPASRPEIPAPDIAVTIAGMRVIDQARHLALSAVGHLARAIQQDIAVNAAWQKWVGKLVESAEKKTTHGKVADLLMTMDMSKSELMGDIDESIELLLNVCLDAPFLKERLSIISMETKRITIQKILECIQATECIRQNTTRITKTDHPIGELGINGIESNCPFCRYESVPQTRKRMIVRAIRGNFVPYLPQPEPWVGWYQAIEDLIPTLPETNLATWQWKALPDEIRTMLLAQGGYDGGIVTATPSEPAFTMTPNSNQTALRALTVDCQGSGDPTLERGVTTRGDSEPMFTVTTGKGQKQPIRAVIIDSTNVIRESTSRTELEPMFAVTASNCSRPSHISAGIPEFHGYRVVTLSIRCLARFQSIPDWYQFSGVKTLDAKGIGNAIPPLGYQKLLAPLIDIVTQ